MMHRFGEHGWWWIIGLILLVFIIWMVVKAINQDSRRHFDSKSALDILKERYARGEIDKEEFEERKKDLM